MARVNVSVGDAQKERWEDHVDDSREYATLSQLVRSAVEAELSETTGVPDTGSRGMTEEAISHFGDLKSEIRDLKDQLEGIEAHVKTDPRLEEMASEVFDLVPTEDDLNLESTVRYSPGEGLLYLPGSKSATTNEYVETPAEEVNSERLAATGQIEALAHILGESSHVVQEAIEKLSEDTAMVRSDVSEGTTRYYRKK